MLTLKSRQQNDALHLPREILWVNLIGFTFLISCLFDEKRCIYSGSIFVLLPHQKIN